MEGEGADEEEEELQAFDAFAPLDPSSKSSLPDKPLVVRPCGGGGWLCRGGGGYAECVWGGHAWQPQAGGTPLAVIGAGEAAKVSRTVGL